MQELIKENEFLRDELSRVRKECDEYEKLLDEYEKLLDEIRIFSTRKVK
ncbi:hypothetical protein Si087_00206 [Streptococcus infantarius subsp. infantarius]|nr:hypothetical protein [Streptococcus infantarius subsp. infantarius]